MAFLTWTPGYSVSVTQFDEQHRVLFALVNKLHEAMKAGQSRAVLGDIFTSLVSYTKTHFADEEKLMVAQGYPAYGTHKKAHDDLTQQALALQGRFAKGEVMISVEVLNFLESWLTKHIQGMDKEYGPYFNGKGIK